MTSLGAVATEGSTRFAVRSPAADRVWLCLFQDGSEARHEMRREGEVWSVELPGNLAGRTYGYRADGVWLPEQGRWFDPAKLLVDPYAVELDRRFVQHPDLALLDARGHGRPGDLETANVGDLRTLHERASLWARQRHAPTMPSPYYAEPAIS